MNVKSSTTGYTEDIFSCRGLKVLHSLCLQRTPRTAKTAVMMTVLTKKHGWNKDELGTQLVYAVFAEKSQMHIFISSVPIWATFVDRGTKGRETSSMCFTTL